MKSSNNAFYPNYILGESAYSWVARFHLTRPSSSWQATNRILFGKDCVRLHSVLPAYLQIISSHSQASEETLLFNATGYSLFAYMQENLEWAKKLQEAMMSGNGGRIATLASLCASKLPFHSCLKFCPECLEIDRANYGTPYWHSEHQLYGVWSCPTHGLRLIELTCGDGGVNHNYLLPEYRKGHAKNAIKVIQTLSRQIATAYEYLNTYRKPIFPSNAYSTLLQNRGYITEGGCLRWAALQRDMRSFWHSLFSNVYLDHADLMQDFQFVPSLVHSNKRIHYFKHSLLLGFLCSNIQNMTGPDSIFTPKNNKQPAAQHRKTGTIDENALQRINQGESLRSIAKSIQRSVGYLIQLAKRNSIETETRTKFITPVIERSIWRQAFMGLHRSEIADHHQCCVGAVEKIIQSHKLLSKWRAHLRHINHLRRCRATISEGMIKNPNAHRSEIQKLYRSDYTWLYKWDREWLNEALPTKLPGRYKNSVDWGARDKELAKRIKSGDVTGRSLSAIDRQLGGHSWLLQYKSKLPLTIKAATKVINRTKP